MLFDDVNRGSNSEYSYTQDPQVESVEPLATFRSGGRVLTVTGANLDVVGHPRMYITDRDSATVRSTLCISEHVFEFHHTC